MQNKIQKMESELLNPSVKKLPLFAHTVNSVSDQAAMTLKKKRLWLVTQVQHERPNAREYEYYSEMAPLWLKSLLQSKITKRCQ
jgi:hypothetical protein